MSLNFDPDAALRIAHQRNAEDHQRAERWRSLHGPQRRTHVTRSEASPGHGRLAELLVSLRTRLSAS